MATVFLEGLPDQLVDPDLQGELITISRVEVTLLVPNVRGFSRSIEPNLRFL